MRFALLFAVHLGATAAWGNPMMSTSFHAMQVPGTHHVQVTWLNIGQKVPKVSVYLRDDKAYELQWKPFDGFKSDQGSGVGSYPVAQACDCNVAVGHHTFRVMPNGQKSMDELPWGTLRAEFDVLADKPDPAKVPPAPPPEPKNDTERMLLRLHEENLKRRGEVPKGVQGLDCRAECKGEATAPVAAEQPKSTAVHREATIEKGSWLVLNGRYVRPPYKFVLDDYKLTVNGQLVEQWDAFMSARQMDQTFKETTWQFQPGNLVVRCGWQTQTKSFLGAAQVTGWFKKIDQIVHEQGDRTARAVRLARETSNVFLECADQLLDHWDGYQ